MNRQAGIAINPDAAEEFDSLFLDWLDRQREQVECGGSGNHEELMTLCVEWAHKHLCMPIENCSG